MNRKTPKAITPANLPNKPRKLLAGVILYIQEAKVIKLRGIMPRGSITDKDIAEVKRFFRETLLARIEHFNDTPEGWQHRLDRIEPPRFEAREGDTK